MSVAIESGDIIFKYHDRFLIRPDSKFGEFFLNGKYFKYDQNDPRFFATSRKELVAALRDFLDLKQEVSENSVLMIERNGTGCIRKEEQHPGNVVPLSYQQMKQKYLNKEIPKVNEQIEKTFDGYSARVFNLQPAVRNEFEKHGWEIRVWGSKDSNEFEFTPK